MHHSLKKKILSVNFISCYLELFVALGEKTLYFLARISVEMCYIFSG